MKKIKIRLLLLLSIPLVFSFYSCVKEDPVPVPPITAENTFSCKIDGELFVPENHGGFIPLYGYLIDILEDNSWIVTLSNGKKTFYLFIKKVDHTGFYEVFKSDGDLDFLYDENTVVELTDDVSNSVYTSLNNSGDIEVLSYTNGQKLILKFDEIILGSTTNPNETIILTDGKLNINKETLNQN